MQKGKPESEFEKILLHLKDTRELWHIIKMLELDEFFDPIKLSAERVTNRIEKELSKFPKIKKIEKRVKTLDSILFKMLCVESTQNINRINDVVGLRAIVERVKDCYGLFNELLEEGFDPYFKIFDTLDKTNKYYRSLDTNFLYKHGNCFQLQIRTPHIQGNYENGGELSNDHYKKVVIREVVKLLKKDELFGIDYRKILLGEIAYNFDRGSEIYGDIESSKRYSLINLLDMYSHEDLDYDKIGEIRLTNRSKEIFKLHMDLIHSKEIFFPFKRLTVRPSFRKIVEDDYDLSKSESLPSFSEAVND